VRRTILVDYLKPMSLPVCAAQPWHWVSVMLHFFTEFMESEFRMGFEHEN
jgi:hypothetical protein